MKFHVRSGIVDLLRFKGLVSLRKKKILAAAETPIPESPVNILAAGLHPKELRLVVSRVTQETASARTFRLEPDPSFQRSRPGLPSFRAGQYLSVRAAVDGTPITRAYSISSSPLDAADNGFYELTIRKTEGGFLTEWIWEHWKEGTRVTTSGPCGFFYHEPLRDSKEILALAGGSGITPFRSMMKDIVGRERDLRITLIYGTRLPSDIIFEKELADLARTASDRIRVHIVCSEPDGSWKGPRGLLTAALIRDLTGEIGDKSIFICGPPRMYELLDRELAQFKIPRRRIRRELIGRVEEIVAQGGFPRESAGKRFSIRVRREGTVVAVPAASEEAILVSLERAGLCPPSECRSGECGFCRSRLIDGSIYVSEGTDGRRGADRIYGWFHPCSSYPLSDLEIEVPRGAP